LATALSVDQLQAPEAYVPTVVTPSPPRESLPTATHSVVEGQLTAFKKPGPFVAEITVSSVDQLQILEAYVPTVVTPSPAPFCPSATQSDADGQLTPFKVPSPVAPLATGLSVDQLQAPEAYVPTVVTPLLSLSSPTATHNVVEGQLTPFKVPSPVPSSTTELSVDQLQAPEAYVPTVVTPSSLAPYPAATHSVVEGQLTPSKVPSPDPSSTTELSVDQLQAPETYVPTVVTPSLLPSYPAATHSVTEGQLTASSSPVLVPSLATALSVDQLQAPEAYVPTVMTPLPGKASLPTATHSVIEGQLTPFKTPKPVPSLATGLSVDQLHVPDVSVPMVVTPSSVPSDPAATQSVTEGQLTASRDPWPVPSLPTELSRDQLQAPEAYVPTVVAPSMRLFSLPTATHSVVEGQLTAFRGTMLLPSEVTADSGDPEY
jgi:hypothetical protein